MIAQHRDGNPRYHPREMRGGLQRQSHAELYQDTMSAGGRRQRPAILLAEGAGFVKTVRSADLGCADEVG